MTTRRTFPLATLPLAVAMLLAFAVELRAGGMSACARWGFVAAVRCSLLDLQIRI